jgi:hypothetical protein
LPIRAGHSIAQLDEMLVAVDLCLDEDARKRLDAAGHGTDH